jgi:hypothetical protein
MMENFDCILTPTSPPLKDALIDSVNSTIFSSMPYEQSADYWQPNKDVDYSSVNCMNNFYDYSTITDTPDSVVLEPKYENYPDDENYFKFDADTIEKLMPPSDSILQLDTEYVNYNEDNCNSKNNSPCSSPWIDQQPFNLDEFKFSNSSASATATQTLAGGGDNLTQILQLNNTAALPSINQIFSQNFSNYATASQDEYILFPAAEDGFFDVGMANTNPYESSNSELELSKHSPINLDNYNFPSNFDDKPNREFKNIWSEIDDEKVINSFDHQHDDVAEVIRKSDEIADEKLHEQFAQDNGLICCWEKCNLSFESQIDFVTHIEKKHVCIRKGDEYTCLWTECPRKFMPFNARYKLLIHMRGKFKLYCLPLRHIKFPLRVFLE